MPTLTDVRIRHISERDWAGVDRLETTVYQAIGLSETEDVLRSRAAVSPATCFVVEAGRRLAGYLIALPCPMFEYPAIGRLEGVPDRDSRNLHLHDLVIAQDFRGRGLATRVLRHLTAIAISKTYDRISLVSVAGSRGFWSANGYRAYPEVPPPPGYGQDAVYMSMVLRYRP